LPASIPVGSVLALLFCLAAGAEEVAHPAAATERITDLRVSYVFEREGTISMQQTFRVRVTGGKIKRGPVLNYLTVFPGPAGLILGTEMEIDGVLRDGKPEPFREEKGSGFLSLLIGSPEVELEHREHTYTVTSRSKADWRQAGGEFAGVIDVTGSVPRIPIDRVEVNVSLPEGVTPLKFSPAVTGFEERPGPEESGFKTILQGSKVTVRTTRALGENHSFFINLAWPSGTFALQSQWMRVIQQHPRIPLAAFSGVLLIWALLLILWRASDRRRRT
jgi:hypothetical protein